MSNPFMLLSNQVDKEYKMYVGMKYMYVLFKSEYKTPIKCKEFWLLSNNLKERIYVFDKHYFMFERITDNKSEIKYEYEIYHYEKLEDMKEKREGDVFSDSLPLYRFVEVEPVYTGESFDFIIPTSNSLRRKSIDGIIEYINSIKSVK